MLCFCFVYGYHNSAETTSLDDLAMEGEILPLDKKYIDGRSFVGSVSSAFDPSDFNVHPEQLTDTYCKYTLVCLCYTKCVF